MLALNVSEINHSTQIILASSSQTRKDLMNRLRLDYQCISPDIDESPRGERHADHLAKRLAFEKAQVISQDHPNAIVIGSDQVAWREHTPQDFIGKPLTVENAIQQLQLNSGKNVYFSTALSVQHLASGFEHTFWSCCYRDSTFYGTGGSCLAGTGNIP